MPPQKKRPVKKAAVKKAAVKKAAKKVTKKVAKKVVTRKAVKKAVKKKKAKAQQHSTTAPTAVESPPVISYQEIERKAFEFYQDRLKNGNDGDQFGDWVAAEQFFQRAS